MVFLSGHLWVTPKNQFLSISPKSSINLILIFPVAKSEEISDPDFV